MHLVTVLEDMPVQETLDGIAELRDLRLPVGGVVTNLAHPTSSTGTSATRCSAPAWTPTRCAPTCKRRA